MRVVITGATGFIGRALCKELHKDYEVIALSRNSKKAAKSLGPLATIVQWDGRSTDSWANYANGAFAIINLAGENIASGRWTESKRAAILKSRINSARAVVEAIESADIKPKLVIQASAIGYYGSRGDELLNEDSARGEGFLADVCGKCEDFAKKIGALGIRGIVIRTGVVLGGAGGALPKFMLPFRFFLGGHIGRLFLIKRHNNIAT